MKLFHSPRRRLKNLSLYFVCLLSLAACQPSLWGAAPPPPTPVPPTITPTSIPPTPLPTFTPAPPNAAPTPLVLTAAQVWVSPTVPDLLRQVFSNWGFQVFSSDQNSANLYVDVVQPAPGALHVSTWTYALVAPFPTVVDGVTSQELLSSWSGTAFGPFAGRPLMMEESTLKTFTALWGPPAAGAVQVVDGDQLLSTAWNSMPAWAIVPFERVEPKWKVLTIDDQSPIRRNFDPSAYPLVATFRLMCVNPCQVPSDPQFSFQNYDPSKLTTLVMTGVTALVRATARTMNTKGILYPAEVIGDMLREADILHINNEVPFFNGCPPPDPNQIGEVFCSDPRYIELLTSIGTDVMELSGDHFADYKAVAMNQTLDMYDQIHLAYYGGGRNVDDGRKPLLIENHGNKLMFIGCNYKTIYASATATVPGAVPCDFDYMDKQITAYRAQGYLPIATYQYHEFDSPEARPQQMLDFRRQADAGAVIVSGSQAHIPQVMEFYQDAFIHYGLGNLFFDQIDKKGPHFTQREFIDRHIFYDGKYLGVELITCYLEDYSRPRFMTEAERTKFLSEYFKYSGWDFPQVSE